MSDRKRTQGRPNTRSSQPRGQGQKRRSESGHVKKEQMRRQTSKGRQTSGARKTSQAGRRAREYEEWEEAPVRQETVREQQARIRREARERKEAEQRRLRERELAREQARIRKEKELIRRQKEQEERAKIAARKEKEKKAKKIRKERKQEVRREMTLLDRTDFKIWIALIFLCGYGLIMVYSASSYDCAIDPKFGNNPAYFLKKQVECMILGVLLLLGVSYSNPNWLKRGAVVTYCIALGCICMLKIPGISVSANGATRWLKLTSFFQFQVAEVVKVAVIIVLAYIGSKYAKALGKWRLTLIMWGIGAFMAFLIFKISNDLSSAIVILGITVGITLICARTIKMHLGAFVLAAVTVTGIILQFMANLPTPQEMEHLQFRYRRIAAWLAPERYADHYSYQIMQSLYAVGSGGFWGRGLGNSIQKRSAIPEAQNDMIFSIICEELGMVGVIILLILFIYLLYEILRVATQAENLFCSALCQGVFWHIALQVMVNIAVNTNLFPNTGIALPFISYGGTSICLLFIEIGIVLAVERNHRARMTARELQKKRQAEKEREKERAEEAFL